MRKTHTLTNQPLTDAERRRVVRHLLQHDRATEVKLWSVMGSRGRRPGDVRFALERAIADGMLDRHTAAGGTVYYRLTPEARTSMSTPAPATKGEPSLFEPDPPTPRPLIDQTRTPPADVDKPDGPAHNGTDTSEAGARKIAREAGNLRTMVVGSLASAGERGLTLQELAPIVSRKRGTPTKETSLTGRLDELSGYEGGRLDRQKQWAVKTTLRRDGGAGVPCAVWVHIRHWRPEMGDQKAIDFAKKRGGRSCR